MATHSEKLIAKALPCLFLYRGYTQDQELVYAFLATTADKLAELRKAMRQPTFDLTRYGNVVAAGFGEPSYEICAQMAERFGFDYQNAQDMMPLIAQDDVEDADETS